jgi:spermidine synthase
MALTAKQPLNLWVEELHQDVLGLRYKVKKTLFTGESRFQQIDIVETEGFGRMLFNDGVAMISERDEFVYHEMISHVPLFVHPCVERVLVIGGGDGGTARELLRHSSVRHCRLVEIDPLVLEGCREHIPQTAAALGDARVEVTVGDGVEFVAKTDERYDLVIVDSTDPIGPATPLFGPEFYRNVRRVLNDDGIVVSQAESPFYEAEQQRSLLEILAGLFRRVQLYNYVNLTYPGGLWSFSLACKSDLCPIGDFDPQRVRRSGLEFRWYGPAVHQAAFVLPGFQAADLARYLTPFKRPPFPDGSPADTE